MRCGGLTLALACLAVAACESPPPAPPSKAVVVLFDLSESTAKPEMRHAYEVAFRAVLDSLRPGDALVAGWITDRSAGELTLPVRLELPPVTVDNDNPRVVEAKQREAQAAVKSEADKAYATVVAGLENPGRKILKTDIMASLPLAERVFAAFPRERKVLVLMSDMLEDSDHYVFERLALTPQASEKIITTERAAGRLPSLPGVRIHVVGASGPSDDKILEVKRFWEAYFKASGADLRQEDYGAALVRFGE